MVNQKTTSIDYWDVLKKAFQITFRHKFLWVFGLFLGVSSGGANFGSFNTSNFSGINTSSTNIQSDAQSIFTDYLWIFILVGIVVFLIMSVVVVLSFISQGALIGGVDKIATNKKVGFKDSFKIGVHHFWRILGISILIGIAALLLLLFLGVPTVLLFVFKLWLPAILLLILTFLIFFPIAIVLGIISTYAFRYTVIKETRVIESIKSGWRMFRHNLWPSLLIALIIFLVSMVSGIVLLLAFLVVGIPLALLGFISYAALKLTGVIIVLVLAAVILGFIVLLYGAILNTFSSTAWTLFFRELQKRVT